VREYLLLFLVYDEAVQQQGQFAPVRPVELLVEDELDQQLQGFDAVLFDAELKVLQYLQADAAAGEQVVDQFDAALHFAHELEVDLDVRAQLQQVVLVRLADARDQDGHHQEDVLVFVVFAVEGVTVEGVAVEFELVCPALSGGLFSLPLRLS
jgi:hypothetical protein